jgi:hypothetical protein
MRCKVLKGFGGVKIEKKRGSVKSVNPIDWGHTGLERM